MFYHSIDSPSVAKGVKLFNDNGGEPTCKNKGMMAETYRKLLLELLNRAGNDVCGDCKRKGPEWASYNIGVFLCTQCAGIHRNLGSHISKIKSLRLDNWDADQVKFMEDTGNLKVQEKYEVHVPLCYRRPKTDDVQVLKEQWIRAKYQREEFIHPDKQIYLNEIMEGWVWKRGKDGDRFQLRKFVLSDVNNTLKYYVKEHHKEPKAVIRVSDLNVTFCPSKIGNLNGMQLTYIKDGSTRNIFLYTEDSKDIVDWYMAIRSAKLNHLQVAFPGISNDELVQRLTRDFLKEGWLSKTGPRSGDSYKKRWFTLDARKLMYLEDPLDIVDWYMAIRSAKLNHLQVAFPGISNDELVQRLTRDFLKEGWLSKTGPRSGDSYKKRWFTLDARKLMYLEDPLDAYPKGEIFLGNVSEGYSVKLGVPPHLKSQGFSFTLKTPERVYLLSAETGEEREEWMTLIQQVLQRPLTPQDKTMKLNLMRKH